MLILKPILALFSIDQCDDITHVILSLCIY